MKFKTPLQQFRSIAILEGFSYVFLFVTMLLKYKADMPLPNKIIGYAHGLLFVAYIVWLYLNMVERKWNLKIVFLLFLASLVPFGTFIADRKFLKKEEEIANDGV